MHFRLPGLLCIASVSLGQAFAQADVAVQGAFAQLRSQPSIWLRQTGTDTLGNTTATFAADVFWEMGVDARGVPIYRLESIESRNGSFTRRIVGDGATLWTFDAVRNEYAAQTYDAAIQNAGRTNALKDLLTGFKSHARGESAYAARLLNEVYQSGGALFKPWVSGQSWQVLDPNSMNDPLLGSSRVYAAGPQTQFAVYFQGTSIQRSLAFRIGQAQQNGPWELQRIYFADQSALSGQTRLIDWQMSVSAVAAGTGNFQFVPPADARPVVKVGGG